MTFTASQMAVFTLSSSAADRRFTRIASTLCFLSFGLSATHSHLHHLHAHKTQTAAIITLTVKHSLKDISSVTFTILSNPDDAFNCTEMDFRFGGRLNEFYQPLQASVLVDLLYTLTVTQAVGKYLQGLNMEVSEVLHKREFMWKLYFLHQASSLFHTWDESKAVEVFNPRFKHLHKRTALLRMFISFSSPCCSLKVRSVCSSAVIFCSVVKAKC